jgi:MFS family permease/quinol monooxygenase YgiN
MNPAKEMHQTSAMEPLKVATFRAIWLSALCTNTGLFIQDVGAAWLMTSLSSQPFMIALMQTAATLPFFLLALPAGALADLLDRRKIVLGTQLWMVTAAATLGFLTLTGTISPWVLLTLTFLLFSGNAFGAPAWSAITPELVPRKHLEPAIGLGSAGYNMSRGAGAAIGGLIVAKFGPAFAFITNACCYVIMINTLLRWEYKRESTTETSEHIVGAMRAGIRYVRHSHALKAVLVRTIMFATASSVLFSLLPLLAREQLKLNSIEYGMIVSWFGIGTLLGAIFQPRLRMRLTLDQMSMVGTILFAMCISLLACSQAFWMGLVSMVGCGIAWTIKNSALNVAVQMAAPNWVRARAYSVYLLVYQGCVAAGSILWGTLATWQSMPTAMLVAACALLIGMIAGRWHKLGHAERLNVNESTHWRDPELTHHVPDPNDGPVMVSVEYLIEPERAEEFLETIKRLEIQRRRDGAYQWHVFRDLADERKFTEQFLVETWGEHMRQHERVTMSDRVTEQAVDAFHVGKAGPKVTHFVAANPARVRASH